MKKIIIRENTEIRRVITGGACQRRPTFGGKYELGFWSLAVAGAKDQGIFLKLKLGNGIVPKA